MSRVLLVTNDFPPRAGGIQSFVYGMADNLRVDDLVVYASAHPGAPEFDARQPFDVKRDRSAMLLPTARVGRAVRDLARRHDCDTVWFGAAAPLGLLASGLKRHTGIRHAVALTHGHETGWAALPAARGALRRIARGNDIVTYLTEYSRQRLHPVMAPHTRLENLTFGVDTARFHPDIDGSAVRQRHGLNGRRVVACVSRLVTRKGQDSLIAALPRVRETVPEAALLLIGDGPYRAALRRQAAACGVAEHVVITGAVSEDQLPAHYAAADVFAMPCRTRRAGLDVEGLGVVYLEAAATGLPVIAGDSGGAPDTVREGETGYVANGRDLAALADRLVQLLRDRQLAARLGAAGRQWMCGQWNWPRMADQLAGYLKG